MAEYGLLGRGLDHSFSSDFFKKKFKKEELPHRYRNFDLHTLKDIRDLIAEENFKGLNVTIPYKTEIMTFLDFIDPVAKKIGAVNTIKMTTEGLIGYNTDAFGFEKSLKEKLESHHQKALVLGTGGASKAVVFILKNLNIDFQLVSRFKHHDRIAYDQIDASLLESYHLIINCTPVGTFPKVTQAPAICYDGLNSKHFLFDLVYNPAETEFLKRGKMNGASVSNGFNMLIYQAEKAWEIWNS